MKFTCVVGLQWGDEAKGKIVDLIGGEHDYVVRYNGGPNAGHTIVHGDRTFRLSILPSGILRPEVVSVIGNGLVIHPVKLLDEIAQLAKAGMTKLNLYLSDHAHVIFPYHVEEERVNQSGTDIGTTGRGIGPCYQDKVGRSTAIRVGDLLYPEILREKLRSIVPRKNRLLVAMNTHAEPAKQFDADLLCDEYLGYAEQLRPYITETTLLLRKAVKAGKKLLFEGAQGSLLDIDHGTYPFVTSSSSICSGIWPGTGVSARLIGRIIGVVKAYTTRVGRGPFPTELDNEIGERIRKIGREYGTVTGRPRRVGWFDAVAARHTAELADADEITVMLVDVLSGLAQIEICHSYTMNGETITDFPADGYLLERCTANYETLPGWTEDLTKCRHKHELPAAALRYVERIGELVGKPISMVSVGPDREQTIPMM